MALLAALAWAAGGLALQFVLAADAWPYLAYYLGSLLLVGWRMRASRRWCEILETGPHPLSPAAASWTAPSETERAAARRTCNLLEVLGVSMLVLGLAVFLIGQRTLLAEGGRALFDPSVAFNTYRLLPAAPRLFFLAGGGTLLLLLGVLVADVLADVREGTSSEGRVRAVRRWLARLFLVGVVLTAGFWSGWLSQVEGLLGLLTVGLFGGAFLLIVRWTW